MGNVLVKNRSILHDFITGEGRRYPIIIKGTQTLDVGYIFVPYIPTQLEPITMSSQFESEDFNLTDSILSRYTTINNRFYGTITVNDFDNLGNG